MAHTKTPPVEIFFNRDLTEEDRAFLRSPECSYTSDDIGLILKNHLGRYEKVLTSEYKIMLIMAIFSIVLVLHILVLQHFPFWNNMLNSVNQQLKLILEQAHPIVTIAAFVVIAAGSYWFFRYIAEVNDLFHQTANDCDFLRGLHRKKTSVEQSTISP